MLLSNACILSEAQADAPRPSRLKLHLVLLRQSLFCDGVNLERQWISLKLPLGYCP